ncbi:HET-domain-containing protein [Apiospora aurea]|uniref:HET-domain-containing protein n=1 Tax=Apiospora aurea TaxID=335848 RepID=A0ABR1QGC9_9PEZI
MFKIEYGSPEVPSYDAISYQWGDPNGRWSLKANGQDISVTCSLYTALTYMRHESCTRILWIDGVCINQEDTAEREQQVLKMGAIFSGAQCVRIFLGEAEDGNNVAQAIDLLSNLGTLEDHPHFIERIRLDQDSSRGLINLLRRPYWQRMWMFQEIVLAKKAVVHCGPYNISWENMRELDKISGDPEVRFQAQVSCDWILELRRALFDLAHFFVSEAEAQDFRNVLEPTRRLQCTNPRDKLFALIGVCNNIPIRADYSRSVRDIYTDFTRQHLLAGYDMSPLLTAGLWNLGNGPQLDLPSWVPDYRGTHGVDIRYLAASHLAHFNASLKIKRSIGFPSRFKSPNPNEDNPGGAVGPPPYMLATRGVIIDTVRAVTTLKNVQNSPQGLLRLVEPNGLDPRSPSGEEDHAQVLFRTMIFDDKTLHTPGSWTLECHTGSERYIRLAMGFAHCLSLGDSPDKSSQARFLNSFTGLKIGKWTLAGLKIGRRSLRQHYEQLLQSDPGQLQCHYREFLMRSKETSEKSASSFFVTKNDRVGKGPRDLDRGDCVAFIYGCRIPLVLRPLGARFQLVGPCYFHGAMFAEASSPKPRCRPRASSSTCGWARSDPLGNSDIKVRSAINDQPRPMTRVHVGTVGPTGAEVQYRLHGGPEKVLAPSLSVSGTTKVAKGHQTKLPDEVDIDGKELLKSPKELKHIYIAGGIGITAFLHPIHKVALQRRRRPFEVKIKSPNQVLQVPGEKSLFDALNEAGFEI